MHPDDQGGAVRGVLRRRDEPYRDERRDGRRGNQGLDAKMGSALLVMSAFEDAPRAGRETGVGRSHGLEAPLTLAQCTQARWDSSAKVAEGG